MHTDGINFSRPLALEYLQRIEALTQEIQAGMEAVGANALPTLQQSVVRQQEMCSGLSQLSRQVRREQERMRQGGAASPPIQGTDRALADRIRLAAESLQALNKSYGALLKHSGESARLFTALCRSYTGQFQQPTARARAAPAGLAKNELEVILCLA